MLLEFAAQAALRSTCLNTLHIIGTHSSAEDGDMFLQVLADHTIDSLHHLTISEEHAWFANDRDGCMAPLLALLARQTSLESLTMRSDDLEDSELLSYAQKQQIRKVVTSNAPECRFDL